MLILSAGLHRIRRMTRVVARSASTTTHHPKTRREQSMAANAELFGRGGYVALSDVKVDPQTWGRLEWMVSGDIGNSDNLTVGKCYIQPHDQNPPHYHPNCDEVLHVLRGTIRHRLGDEYIEMSAGDTISIPQGTIHNAENLGDTEAEFVIIFSTATREVVGE
jgi:quercetin dioxygenase-like cupin family protein